MAADDRRMICLREALNVVLAAGDLRCREQRRARLHSMPMACVLSVDTLMIL
jgi:hypothetical protein